MTHTGEKGSKMPKMVKNGQKWSKKAKNRVFFGPKIEKYRKNSILQLNAVIGVNQGTSGHVFPYICILVLLRVFTRGYFSKFRILLISSKTGQNIPLFWPILGEISRILNFEK